MLNPLVAGEEPLEGAYLGVNEPESNTAGPTIALTMTSIIPADATPTAPRKRKNDEDLDETTQKKPRKPRVVLCDWCGNNHYKHCTAEPKDGLPKPKPSDDN